MTKKPDWREPRFLDPESVQPVLPGQNTREPIAPVAIDDKALLLPTIEEAKELALEVPVPNRWGRRFGKTLLLVAALSGGISLGQLILWGNETHPLLGAGLAALVAFLVASGALALWREAQGIRQLEQLKELRNEAQQACDSEDHGRAAVLLGDLSKFYGKHSLAEAFGQQRHVLDPRYSNREYLQLLSQRTLAPIDKTLYQLVTRRSLESAVLVGVSPMVSLDMLLMLWRNTRMLREIAAHYGLKTSFSGRFYLFKQVLHNLAFVGVSEAVIDTGNELLGASVVGTVSARAGQGMAAGVLTARLGLQAIQLCRPLPFIADDHPSMTEIRGQLLAQSRQLFRDKDSGVNKSDATSVTPHDN